MQWKIKRFQKMVPGTVFTAFYPVKVGDVKLTTTRMRQRWQAGSGLAK